MQAWAKAVRQVLVENPDVYDARFILTPGMEAVKETVRNKIREFGTSQQALVYSE